VGRGSRRQAVVGGGGLRVCMYRIRLGTEMYWSGAKVLHIFVVLGRNAIVQSDSSSYGADEEKCLASNEQSDLRTRYLD